MLGRRISAATTKSLRRKGSSVCILAGYNSMDAQGARIMKSLNERAGENIKYFGLGGEKMVETGLEDNLADIHQLTDKPLYIHKNAHAFHRERLYAVYMMATRYRNWKVVKQIEKELYPMLFANQPDAVISLGNEYFMKRLYLMIDRKYEEKAGSKLIKPPMIHFDRMLTGQHVDHLKYLDHFFYSVPVPVVNWQYYTFPSTFYGSQGLFDAYEYLYKRSKSHSQLATAKSIWLNEEYNNVIMEELILDSRAHWREKHNVPETNTVIFVSPGSDRKEIKWSGALVSKAVDQFINKFSKVAADNFTVVISLPKDLQDQAASLQALKWKCRVIFVLDRQDRFGAMSVRSTDPGQRLWRLAQRRRRDRSGRHAAASAHPGQDGRLAHLLDAAVQPVQQQPQSRREGRSLPRADRHGFPREDRRAVERLVPEPQDPLPVHQAAAHSPPQVPASRPARRPRDRSEQARIYTV